MPVLATRRDAPLNATLRAQFDVIEPGVHVVVLDAGGETLDQFWLDTLWSCAHDESLARFDELLVERLERSLAGTVTVESLERRWLKAGDAETFADWMNRLEELKRYRYLERVCSGPEGAQARTRGFVEFPRIKAALDWARATRPGSP